MNWPPGPQVPLCQCAVQAACEQPLTAIHWILSPRHAAQACLFFARQPLKDPPSALLIELHVFWFLGIEDLGTSSYTCIRFLHSVRHGTFSTNAMTISPLDPSNSGIARRAQIAVMGTLSQITGATVSISIDGDTGAL